MQAACLVVSEVSLVVQLRKRLGTPPPPPPPGGVSLFKSFVTLLQLHHFVNAFSCITSSEKTEQYVGGRLFQAVIEVRQRTGRACALYATPT
jgi:hypothetical protein